MRMIFHNTELQRKIDKDGFVVIPFLNENEVKQLTTIYESIDSSMEDSQFYLSIWSKNESYKRETHNKLVEIIKDKCRLLFDNYKHVVSNYAVKYPGDKSEFDLHQGINFIDETKGHISVTMWIPLQDVNIENGNMQIVRGSHRFFNQDVRSQHYQTPYEKIKPFIKELYLENVPMKAGEAWIFNHRLLHCSPMNFSEKVRIATLNVLVPEECPVILYYKNGDDVRSSMVEILEFTQDNYFLQNVYEKPKVAGLISNGTSRELHYEIDEHEFSRLYKKYNS